MKVTTEQSEVRRIVIETTNEEIKQLVNALMPVTKGRKSKEDKKILSNFGGAIRLTFPDIFGGGGGGDGGQGGGRGGGAHP